MNTLLMDNVNKSFGGVKILNDINLNVNTSEIVGLIGPSGSGKTTIVKLITGMEKADTGSVTLLGSKVPNRMVLQSVGYMAQADALYLDLTARDNILFFGNMFGVTKDIINERLNYVTSLVNLNNHLSKKCKTFSGGMKRRLSLAMALIQNPDVLLLDEPTVGIDPELRIIIWDELFKLKKEGKSIIVTTHVMDEAEKCDRLFLVRDGRITATGTPLELKEKFKVDTIEDVFLLAGREE